MRTFILVLHRAPDVGKLAILKDEEVVFVSKVLQCVAERWGEVLGRDKDNGGLI